MRILTNEERHIIFHVDTGASIDFIFKNKESFSVESIELAIQNLIKDKILSCNNNWLKIINWDSWIYYLNK